MADIPYEALQRGGYVGPRFVSVFFFENVFWRLSIPFRLGAARIDMFDSLISMPQDVRARLYSDPRTFHTFKEHWHDCLDFDEVSQMLELRPVPGDAGQFTSSGQRDLRSSITDLSQEEPNSNAMHSARLAVEKAMKAYLCFEHGFTEKQLMKRFSHEVKDLADEITVLDPACEMAKLTNQISGLASYADRYADKQYSRPQLWTAYRTAQFTMSALFRVITPYKGP